MSRFPYTNSADHVRAILSDGIGEPVSRAQAATLVSEIARILGMSHQELSTHIANDYLLTASEEDKA